MALVSLLLGFGRSSVHIVPSPHLNILLIRLGRALAFGGYDFTAGKEREQRADENKYGEASHGTIIRRTLPIGPEAGLTERPIGIIHPCARYEHAWLE